MVQKIGGLGQKRWFPGKKVKFPSFYEIDTLPFSELSQATETMLAALGQEGHMIKSFDKGSASALRQFMKENYQRYVETVPFEQLEHPRLVKKTSTGKEIPKGVASEPEPTGEVSQPSDRPGYSICQYCKAEIPAADLGAHTKTYHSGVTSTPITEKETKATWSEHLDFLKDVSLGKTLTPEQAKERFDIDLDPGWNVKVVEYEPAKSGYAYSFITPEGWEIRPDETYVSPEGKSYTKAELEAIPPKSWTPAEYYEYEFAPPPEKQVEPLWRPGQPPPIPTGSLEIIAQREKLIDSLKNLYPEKFQPGVTSYGFTMEELPQVALEQIATQLEEEPEVFFEDLYRRATPQESEEFLRALGFIESDISLISTEVMGVEEREGRVLNDIQAIFPDIESIEEFDLFTQENSEAFLEMIKSPDIALEDKRHLLQDMGVPGTEIDAFFATQLSMTEQAKENLAIAWGNFISGDLSWGEIGQMALGTLGVAGAYIEKYIGRPWELAVLSNRAQFQKLIGLDTEFDRIVLQRVYDIGQKYGWAGALVSEDVDDIWNNYIKETGGAPATALKITPWLNPAFFIPIGGTFGVAAKFTTKIPLLGRILKATATGVQAAERGITYPVAKPLELGVRGASRVAQATGERLGKAVADKLIKQTDNLLLEIPETDRLLSGVLVDNWQRRALQTIAKIPPVKAGIEKTLGWRILIKQESKAIEDIVGRAGVAHAEISRMGINAKAIKYWELQDISRNPVKLFGFDKTGYSAKLGGNLEEIFTNPRGFNLNGKQAAYVSRFNEVNQEILNLLKKEGVPPEHLIDDWVHRVVLTEGQKRGISRRVGAKPSYEKVRKFETMADGINYFLEHPELKVYYANNPELLLSDYIQQAFKRIADERFVNYIAKELEAAGKTFGIKPTEKLIAFPELFEEITGKAGRELAEKAVLRTEELSAAKQFTDVVNRALRGEKPHVSTLASLERKFPELGKRFREAIGNKEALNAIKREVAELTEARKLPFWEAKTERAFRMEQLRQPTLREGYIMQPFAGGKLYDREFIDAFNKFFGHEAGLPGLNVVTDVAGILRVTKAALDFSFQAIQGLPSWGLAHAYMLKDPVAGAKLLGAWYKTWAESTAAFFRPEVLAKAIVKEKDIALELVRFGGSARAIDYFEILSAKKGLGGAFEKAAKKIPFTPYERAETAFFGAGQLVRQRFGKILMPKAVAQGKEFELARFLDRITGLTDSAALGVPLTTRQLEQSFVWFAPNYTRACLTVLADIFRGGMTGAMAREALGGMVAAGSAIYTGTQYAISSLAGKSDEESWRDVQEGFGVKTDPITGEVTWQPTGRFMTIKIGNYNMGFGGFWYGLLRLTGNIVACINEVGDREPVDLVRIMKNGTFNKQDNPFIYWWFTRAAPTFGVGFELASGKDFLGYPLETAGDFAKYIVTRFEPIWMEQGINWMIPGMARDNEIPEGLAREAVIPAELFGMRTFPESQWTNFYDKVNEFIKHIPQNELDPKQIEAFKADTLTWKELTEIQRINLLNRYPELEEFYNKAQSDSQVRGSENWKAWQGRVEEEKDTYYFRGNSLVERLISGDLDSREFREMWSDAGQNYGISLDSIEKEPAYAEIYAYFDDKEAEGEKYGFMDDVALQEYVNIVFADYQDEKGDIDWDAKDKAVEEFIGKFGQDTYDRIRQFYDDKKRLEGLNPILIRLADDKDKLSRDYWQLPYKPISGMDDEDLADGYIPTEYLGLWKQRQGLKTDEQREAFDKAHPEIAKDWRAEWRMNNPEDDARLALWGYGGKLQSMEAYDLVTKWGKELGIPLEQMGLGLPPKSIAPLYFEHNKISKDTSPNSVQSKLYKLTDGRKLLDWNLEQGIWADDLSSESIEALKLRDKNKDLTAEYESYGNRESGNFIEDKVDPLTGLNPRTEAQKKFKVEHPEWVDDNRRTRMFEFGVDYPEAIGLVEEFVEYGHETDERGALSAEAMLYRYEHEGLDSFGTKRSEDGKALTLGWEDLDTSRVPIWQIDRQYRGEDNAYQEILDKYEGAEETKQTHNYLYKDGKPTDYCVARYKRQAYENDVPETYHNDYITWFTDLTLTEKPEDYPKNLEYWEDDWFLQEHKDFYKEVYLGIMKNKIPDWTKVPTREIGAKYIEYKKIASGKSIYLNITSRAEAADQYRLDNLDLDKWGVSVGIWSATMTDKRKRAGLTPYEKYIQEREERGEEFKEHLEELKGG